MEHAFLIIIFILWIFVCIIAALAGAAKRGTQAEENMDLFNPEPQKAPVSDITEIPIPQWKNYTIAVDFDKTLCDSKFPQCGPPIAKTVNFVKEAKTAGCKIILWTCRVGPDLEAAVQWCRRYGVKLDAVNENLPEHVAYFGNETRKVYANLYIDDRGINPNLNSYPEIVKE